METSGTEVENDCENNAESWCEVVSKRKKGGKKVQKDDGAKEGNPGKEGLDERVASEKCVASIITPEKVGKKVQKDGGAKEGNRGKERLDEGVASEKCFASIITPADETNKMAAAAESNTRERWSQLDVNEEDEWIEVAPARKKNEIVDKKSAVGQKENKPLPPWRQRQPEQSAPAASKSDRHDPEDRFKALRTDPLPDNAREKRYGKQSPSGTKVASKPETESGQDVEDRFKVLRTENPSEKTPTSRQGKHSGTHKKVNSEKSKTTPSESRLSKRCAINSRRQVLPLAPSPYTASPTKNLGTRLTSISPARARPSLWTFVATSLAQCGIWRA